MKRRRRYSPQQLRALWAHWKQGQSLAEISAALLISATGIYKVVQSRGGMAPRPRTRSALALTVRERGLIAAGVAAKQGVREMARRLARAPSTISREIARNGAPTRLHRRYTAAVAEQRAAARTLRPRSGRLATHHALREVVSAKLQVQWSPTQISEWLQLTYPTDPTMQLSPETIYRALYVQAKGALKRELLTHLRHGHRLRRARGRTLGGRGRGRIVGAVSIAERPAEVADRAVPGHWEGDLLAGSHNSYIATLVERQTRFVLLVKVSGKDTASVVSALIRAVKRLPKGLMASLTWDRGTELAQHAAFTVATEVAVFFCDPQSPWQRGTNENTNGLLRQYFPKGTDLTPISQARLNAVAERLNGRPRQTLGFKTPAEMYSAYLAAHVASTG